MIHIIPTTTELSTKGLINIYLKQIWKLHGIPKKITSGRGPQFASSTTWVHDHNSNLLITYPSLMPSSPLWSLFLLWLIVASAMLLMMLPGSAITCHIISLSITVVTSVLAYCGYSTVLVKAAAITNLSQAIYHCLHQQALNNAISALPGPPWFLTWLAQITKQQHATVCQIGKMNEWHMALHQLLCNISILIQVSNPAPIITSLNAFTHNVDDFAAALYNIDGWLTTLTDNLHGLNTAINGDMIASRKSGYRSSEYSSLGLNTLLLSACS